MSRSVTREAQTLRDLLRIRQHHAASLARRPGTLGSAVGCKFHGDSCHYARRPDGGYVPAVLVFVRRKLPMDALPARDRIPPKLRLPDGLWCETDVIEGVLPDTAPGAPEPTAENRAWLARLRDDRAGLIGGVPLVGFDTVGTAACVVQVGRQPGFLTNWHVAGFPGSEIFQTEPRLRRIGRTDWGLMIAPQRTRDRNDLESFTSAQHRVDIGFVAFPERTRQRIRPGVLGLDPLGAPYQLNLDSLDVIGTEVLGVGQTLGCQQGVIAAYGYVWHSDPDPRSTEWYATDYLIVGTGNRPFAAPGDSGKLVVTADAARQPIALLWGGQRASFWADAAQESWAYASEINLVLKLLGASLLR